MRFCLVALISTSCATTPQVYWDTQIIDSGTGEWRTYELEDKLDGNSLRSSVGIKSNNFLESDAYIVVDSDPLGNVSVGIFNGDSYICDYGTSIRLRFEGSDLYELSSYYDYTISAKKNAFILNNKRDKSKSFLIYEKAKFSNTIEKAFNNDYRKVDIEYDTTKNNRFKKNYSLKYYIHPHLQVYVRKVDQLWHSLYEPEVF